MATYKLKDRAEIQRNLIFTLNKLWKEHPNLLEIISLIVLLAELVYTVFYEVQGDKAKSGHDCAVDGVREDYKDIMSSLLVTRNNICHAYGTRQCNNGLAVCRRNWSQVHDLYLYLLDTITTFNSYCDRLAVPEDLRSIELQRLYAVCDTNNYDTVIEYIKRDL